MIVSLVFRGITAPASLKPLERRKAYMGLDHVFRGITAPASLKHLLLQHQLVEQAGIPGHHCPGLIEANAAASMAEHNSCIPGHHCPGLIEARCRSRSRYSATAVFRGITAPASLKLYG